MTARAKGRKVQLMECAEYEELVPEGSLSSEQAADLFEEMHDLFGMSVSVGVEADAPVSHLVKRLAQQIRAGIGEPDCRIQISDNGRDAVIGPTGLNVDDPQGALQLAMMALGGTWDNPGVTDTGAGPVLHTSRPVARRSDEIGIDPGPPVGRNRMGVHQVRRGARLTVPPTFW
ncbi:hypothetical protein [Streptomyces griseocarneus]|uniref:hypothetical protein n=1 Tax=Streptomyces griseocarneus TaxID=51201 RepID=UPI00167E4D08|nr:hypothetical protein [Streptomyces griseocarneus]MBZ6475445.1 hypothetical protein [Streptomyces griseocarneus]GHG75301.1 hypothetical protein GCM10018779_52810 [Streptomyces griseocarneus]